jgi:hypothetical protein
MRPPRPSTNCRRADWFGGPARYHRIRQVSEVPLLLRSVILPRSFHLPLRRQEPHRRPTPRRTATIYPSKGTSTSTSFHPNHSTASSFAPSIVLWTKLPMHNTLVCSLARRERVGLSPAPHFLPCSRPHAYHPFPGRSSLLFTGFWVSPPFFPLEGFGLACSGAIRSCKLLVLLEYYR